MRKIKEINCRGYYLIESKATARSCYFENEEETKGFKQLFKRYLEKYVEIHKMYLSSEGYQILVRARSKERIIENYERRLKKKGKQAKELFLKEPWRIISEQMRIFHSVFAKWVNIERERSGGLVKERYVRYYFESVEEFLAYEEEMDRGKEVMSQGNVKYRVSERWISGVRWELIRGGEWVKSLIDRAFQDYVVSNLVKQTISLHSNNNSTQNPPP